MAKLSRLWWKIALLLVAIGGAVAFLSPKDPAERKYPGRIPVVFWHTFAGEWQPIYEGMVERFNQSQTKYEVVPVSVPDDANTMKFLLSASGGDTPDLILSWDSILGMWSDKGLIQPYDNVMTAEERAEYLRRTYPIVQKHAIYGGKIMAMVDGLDLYAVYYRLDHLKEIGVDERHLPQTLEDLVALSTKLDRYDENKHLRRVGFFPKGFANFVPEFGGKFNVNGKIVVNTPENIKAMQFLLDNMKRFGFDAVTRFTSSLAADAGPTMPLIAGNYSIMYDGEWRVKQVAQYAPNLPYICAPLPPTKGGKPNCGMSTPNYLMIPTHAHEPKGAWEFAKFCVGFLHPEEGGRNMGDMGWLPDDPYIARSESYQAYLRKYPQYRVFVDLMTSPNLEIPPKGPMQAFVNNEITKAEDAVTRGTAKPKEALDLVQSKLEAEQRRLRRLKQIREGVTP